MPIVIALKSKLEEMKSPVIDDLMSYLREIMKDYLPQHVIERKQKTGWSSPWDNNHPQQSVRWREEDLELLRRLGA